MLRHDISLRHYVYMVAAALVLLGVVPLHSGAAELSLAHFTSPKHPMDRLVMRPWTEDVARLTNRELTIRIYPGGELGKGPKAQYKRAVDGIADVTFGLQGYTSTLFPRTLLVELPGLAPDAMAATQMLWGAIDQIRTEYDRTHVLALWTNDRAVLMTRDKPVRTLDDLKGMKIRTPSKLQGEIIKALGATPVAMPVTRMYNALKTGVVDGLMVASSVIKSFKIGEVARYYTVGPFAHTAFFLVMNKGSYGKLTPDQRQIIDETTGRALSLKAAKVYEEAGAAALQHEADSGRGEIIRLPADEEQRWRAALQGVRDNTVKALEAKAIPAPAILSAMEAAGK
ncbi:TRAP transporter substrate-binding protein [Candidatus Entotheonella palauensis]|nr:TRAP transporter substrate-binding protein [Candidatus Entotheonella palauensis]